MTKEHICTFATVSFRAKEDTFIFTLKCTECNAKDYVTIHESDTELLKELKDSME
jgi:hypothetical protein